MRHRNLPPAAVLPLGNALGGQGRGGHPSGCPGTPASPAIPISGCSVAQGCSRLGVQPPPDEVPAQKATRSQQRLLRTFTATSCPPNRPPEGHPGAGGWFWGGGSGCPHNSAAAPRAPHCPQRCSGAAACGAQTRCLQHNRTAPGRGGGCWEEAPPATQGTAGIYRYWAGSSVSGPSQFPRFLPGEAAAPSPPGSRFLGAVTPQSLDAPGVPPSPRMTNPHTGGHQPLLFPPDTAPSSHFGSSPGGHPGDPPRTSGAGMLPFLLPAPPASRPEPHVAGPDGGLQLTAGRWIYCNDAKISL